MLSANISREKTFSAESISLKGRIKNSLGGGAFQGDTVRASNEPQPHGCQNVCSTMI